MWERGLRARRQRGRSQGNSHQRKSLVHESTGASAPKIDPSCVNADARRAAEAQCAHDIAPTPKSEASNAMGAESWPDHYRGMEITKFLRWIFATNRQRLRVRVRRHLLAKGIFGWIDRLGAAAAARCDARLEIWDQAITSEEYVLKPRLLRCDLVGVPRRAPPRRACASGRSIISDYDRPIGGNASASSVWL